MKFLALFLLLSLPGFAAKKDKGPYQDGVLVSFKTVTVGQSCEGSSASTHESGDLKTKASANCQDTTGALYTISENGHELVLQPRMRLFNKPSVLYGVLPGTHIQINIKGSTLSVKVGQKESKFDLVEAK